MNMPMNGKNSLTRPDIGFMTAGSVKKNRNGSDCHAWEHPAKSEERVFFQTPESRVLIDCGIDPSQDDVDPTLF